MKIRSFDTMGYDVEENETVPDYHPKVAYELRGDGGSGAWGKDELSGNFGQLKEDSMDNPVKDWTLSEVKDYCFAHDCYEGCELAESPGRCKILDVPPCEWDLGEKPRFTEQEVEFARLFKAACKNVVWIQRKDEETLAWVVEYSNEEYRLPFRLFPSIQPGQSYTLDEIIGGAE